MRPLSFTHACVVLAALAAAVSASSDSQQADISDSKAADTHKESYTTLSSSSLEKLAKNKGSKAHHAAAVKKAKSKSSSSNSKAASTSTSTSSTDSERAAGNATNPVPGFDYSGANGKVRGVNIGGWLVAEPWITPSLFDDTNDSRVIDEWTMGKYVDDAEARLKKHWATWITKDDFKQIKAANLNHVRIPIGYWAFDVSKGEPYVKSTQADYLWKACGWAKDVGLKVLIDLHGVPGSQNGFDNSGKKGVINFSRNSTNAARAKAVITKIAKKAQKDYYKTVTAVQLVNEPFTVNGGNMFSYTQQYYRDGYGAMRYDADSQALVLLHDGFQLGSWQGFMPPPNYQQVGMDTHIYSVFNDQQIAMNNSDRLDFYCNQKSSLQSSQSNLWTMVGEWTTAPTDCAKYLNGRGIGARYDGTYPGSTSPQGVCNNGRRTGTGLHFTDTYKAFLKKSFATQVATYEAYSSGWFYWTWRTEQAADWDYQRGLKYGWIPKKLGGLKASC